MERNEQYYEDIDEDGRLESVEGIDESDEVDTWSPVTWYCPNCGTITTAYRKSDGRIKVTCPNLMCHVLMVRKDLGRRHKVIEVYASNYQQEY